MRNNRLELRDLDPANLTDADRRQELVDDFNVVLEEHEETATSAGKTARFSIAAAIVAIAAAIGLSFFGPMGPQGEKGEAGEVGPQGPAISNAELQLAVNTAVEARLANLPKPLTSKEIQELVPVTPPFNDSALKAEIEVLKVKLAEVEKIKAVQPAPSVRTDVPMPEADVRPVALMEEQRLNREATDKDVKWIPYQGYMLPIWKINERGVTGPTEPNLQKPKGYEAWEWTVIRGKSANWALTRAQ